MLLRRFHHLQTGQKINYNVTITVKTVENADQTQKSQKNKNGWAKLKKLKTDYILINLKQKRLP